jgi:hypothetical protein
MTVSVNDIMGQAKNVYSMLHQGNEMSYALEFLLSKDLHNFIEVGCANGASFHCWASVIPDGIKMSVDLNYGFGVGAESNELWDAALAGEDTKPASENDCEELDYVMINGEVTLTM